MTDTAFDRLDAAVAYATAGGLRLLSQNHAAALDRLTKRWLSSFDWCRSEPAALAALNQGARSNVKIYEGREVVARARCAPATPFHPKGFLFLGADARLLISGSGNLSGNGIGRGVEVNTLIDVREPVTPQECGAWNALDDLARWFDAQWHSAAGYTAALRTAYENSYASTTADTNTTEDDSITTITTRGYTATQLSGAARAAIFWIEAGNLTENLGAGNPGSQLMMRALTRVYFGISEQPVARQTQLGPVDIRYGPNLYRDLPMEFAHNGMDRLNLPHPGTQGPAHYDGETLVFRKVPHQGRVVFHLSLVTTQAEKKRLGTASARAGLDLVMSSGGRRFGFVPA